MLPIRYQLYKGFKGVLYILKVKCIYVTEPYRRGLYRRAPCSRVYLAYSLRQLRVGILPPYALDPYNQLRNVL